MKQTGPRHTAREHALRELYGIQLLLDAEIEPLPPIANWWGNEDRLSVTRDAEDLARRMIAGVRADCERLDDLIRENAKNWRIERMPKVDITILRLGAWELVNTDTPINVVLNEALELAKCYGDSDSPRFVNGILDPLAKKARKIE